MNYRSLAFGALCLLVANVAKADVLFDNVNGVPSTGYSGPTDGLATGIMGASFTAGSPDFSSISLFLARGNDVTTGSTMIYLVPDNGSGSGAGQFGIPTIADNLGNFTSLSGSQLIATVSDTSLSSSFSLVNIWVNPMIATQNQEYWVVAISNASSSFEWSYAGDASGVGTGGQAWVNDSGTPGTNLTPISDSQGGYQMVVETPEPTTVAILGGGLAGLGYFRRKVAKKGSMT